MTTGRNDPDRVPTVTLLSGGQDKPYAIGLATALADRGVPMDFIGSDDVDAPELRCRAGIRYVNLRGSQRPDVSAVRKVVRVFKYYGRLLKYAATAKPRIFHILWNERFELFDRVALMLYYKSLGRRIVLTAHNVNARKRDQRDSIINRLSLMAQYALVDTIFVHTRRMREQLIAEFAVAAPKIVVIPFGINNTLPNTSLTSMDARRILGISPEHRVLLFFGRLTPYKGLEYLIHAMAELKTRHDGYRLLIAGPVKYDDGYWQKVRDVINLTETNDRIVEHIGFIPDDKVEVYFKAADVLALPYTDVFQSGVLSLGYSFGLPVIVSDVGSLSEDVVEGETGFVCRPRDPAALAACIRNYFESELFLKLSDRRVAIRSYASERYSWTTVADMTAHVYAELATR